MSKGRDKRKLAKRRTAKRKEVAPWQKDHSSETEKLVGKVRKWVDEIQTEDPVFNRLK